MQRRMTHAARAELTSAVRDRYAEDSAWTSLEHSPL
jgi:hypothetical protein